MNNDDQQLEEWNPLGDAANTVDGLDWYRYAAIDIISTIELVLRKNPIRPNSCTALQVQSLIAFSLMHAIIAII